MNGQITTNCPTPRKKPYRSQAGARRARVTLKNNPRRRDWPVLRPYLCPCGEHWHLTSSLQK